MPTIPVGVVSDDFDKQWEETIQYTSTPTANISLSDFWRRLSKVSQQSRPDEGTWQK